MKNIQQLLAKVDAWQRRNRLVAPLYGVTTKFGNDNMNLYVVGLGWYGFLATEISLISRPVSRRRARRGARVPPAQRLRRAGPAHRMPRCPRDARGGHR